MGRLTVTLENNGESVSLEDITPRKWFKEIGARGFGIAPTEVTIRQGASGGGRHRNTRRLPRTVDLPVLFFGDSADEIEEMMSKLVRIFFDRITAPRIVLRTPGGERWSTEFHYAGGADPQHGVDTDQRTWARWSLALRCPDPYWTRTEAMRYPLRAANSGRGLIKDAPLSKMQVSSSQALGKITVNNPGHVDAFPTWNIYGPGDEFTATRDLDLRSFSFEESISLGETIQINTKDKTVLDNTGENRYTGLSTAPKLFAIPPGQSTISVLLTNATADSLVTLDFQPRKEFMF